MAVKPIPEGYHTITPYLLANGSVKLYEFLKQAFDAKEDYRTDHPDGTIMHATLNIGDSKIMISEASEKFKPMTAMLYLYVEDVDAVYNKAIKAGGTSLREPTNEFYGDRSCGVADECGNQWWIATHIEDVSPEEMKKREEALDKKNQ